MTKSNSDYTKIVETPTITDTKQPNRRQAIKTLAATTTLATIASTTPLFGRYGQAQKIGRASCRERV